ncbi:unnamed protein product [Fusarium equiseti]|uniref:Uncharacterized protein n=1 Tax=Fusarium equiseti TaxID=61235 RepID=A0A8J2ITF9_FUSEQ|nr:unnamed protein product [Fusarium equiseti]
MLSRRRNRALDVNTDTATDTAINGDHILSDAVTIPAHALPHYSRSDDESSVAADQEIGVSVDGLLVEQQEKPSSFVVDDQDAIAVFDDDTIGVAIPERSFVVDANGWSRVGAQPVKAHVHDVRSMPSSMTQIWVKRTVKYEHRIKGKLLPTNGHAILARNEIEIIEYLNKAFVRSPSNGDYLIFRCDYTGKLLPWKHGLRNASLEAVYAFSSSNRKLEYHILPNIRVVMNGLSIMKTRHSPIVLPLISTWLRALTVADFPTREGQLVWTYTAVSNESIMGELLGYLGSRTKFLQFEASNETTLGG